MNKQQWNKLSLKFKNNVFKTQTSKSEITKTLLELLEVPYEMESYKWQLEPNFKSQQLPIFDLTKANWHIRNHEWIIQEAECQIRRYTPYECTEILNELAFHKYTPRKHPDGTLTFTFTDDTVSWGKKCNVLIHVQTHPETKEHYIIGIIQHGRRKPNYHHFILHSKDGKTTTYSCCTGTVFLFAFREMCTLPYILLKSRYNK